MKCRYAALDIETTGEDPNAHQVLEIGCVVETDWATPVEALPTFRCLVEPTWKQIRGEPAALAMNARLLRELAMPADLRPGPSYPWARAAVELAKFLVPHFPACGRMTFAGKNLAGFDFRFLDRMPGWADCRPARRVIDFGVLYFDPDTDEQVPDTAECCRRAGYVPEAEHNAVEDCRTTIHLLRRHFRAG